MRLRHGLGVAVPGRMEAGVVGAGNALGRSRNEDAKPAAFPPGCIVAASDATARPPSLLARILRVASVDKPWAAALTTLGRGVAA